MLMSGREGGTREVGNVKVVVLEEKVVVEIKGSELRVEAGAEEVEAETVLEAVAETIEVGAEMAAEEGVLTADMVCDFGVADKEAAI